MIFGFEFVHKCYNEFFVCIYVFCLIYFVIKSPGRVTLCSCDGDGRRTPDAGRRTPEASIFYLIKSKYLDVGISYYPYLITSLKVISVIFHIWPSIKKEVTRGRDLLFGCTAITKEPFLWSTANLVKMLITDRRFTD